MKLHRWMHAKKLLISFEAGGLKQLNLSGFLPPAHEMAHLYAGDLTTMR